MHRNNIWFSTLPPILAITLFSTAARGEQIHIGRFSSGNLSGWQEKTFVGHTQYSLSQDGDKTVLKAQTSGTASGLFHKVDIDLNKTPYLNWSWKVENIYQDNNEQSKSGDDYPARIYVVVSGGLFFWKTRAINYVWSSNQTKDLSWKNAYTGNARMLAVRSGDHETGQWQSEKRNIREDLKQLFNEDITEINAIAIMSDSDNSQQNATAYYGDIFVSTD
jgi:hypothetical protein